VTHKANQAYIVTDHAGTPQELFSENGEVVWQGEQALWGHYQQQNALPNHGFRENAHNDELYCDLRYQGQIEDRESGLYYNVNRYYDADSGQYLSPDPIGFAGGLRPQAYVFNPLEWVDPLGLSGESHKKTMGVNSSGHHVPAVRKSRGRPFEVKKSDKTRPTLFPTGNDPEHDHWRLHDAERQHIGPRQGDYPGSDKELFDAIE